MSVQRSIARVGGPAAATRAQLSSSRQFTPYSYSCIRTPKPSARPRAAPRPQGSAARPSRELPMSLRGPATAQQRRVVVSAAAAEAGGLPEESVGTGSLLPVIGAVAIAAMGAIEFGYHIAILNGPLELIATELGFAGQQALLGAVISSNLAGAAIGALSGSGFADMLGRRKGLIVSSIPLILGALLMATAQDFTLMVVGRFVTGLGVGLSSCMVPLYIAEVAPTALRGALGSVTQIAICSGILIAQVVNLVLPVEAWRTMLMLAAAPAVVLFAGMLAICPETPSYLMQKGQRAEATKSAKWLWGASGSKEIEAEAAQDKPKEDSAPISELFKGKNRVVALIAFMIFLFQQFSGVNAVFFYSGAVFKQAGVQSVALANAVTGLVNVLGTLAAASVIEKLGRKVLLYGSYAGQGICMAVMGLAMSLPALEPVRTPVVLFGTLLYIMFFAFGCGPVPSLLIPEIAPDRIRGYAVSLAMTSHWVCNFFVGQLFLPMVDVFGVSGVYYFFAATCGVAILFTSKFIVETKGRSLKEIEALMLK